MTDKELRKVAEEFMSAADFHHEYQAVKDLGSKIPEDALVILRSFIDSVQPQVSFGKPPYQSVAVNPGLLLEIIEWVETRD